VKDNFGLSAHLTDEKLLSANAISRHVVSVEPPVAKYNQDWLHVNHHPDPNPDPESGLW
jgi:hypothetical protein